MFFNLTPTPKKVKKKKRGPKSKWDIVKKKKIGLYLQKQS